jgi:antigen flippase
MARRARVAMTDAIEQPDPDPSEIVVQERRMRDIVRSTLIVGGGSLVTVLCGVVRGKVISLTVGPSGVGLQGLLQSTLRTVSSIAGMSLSTSGVREVARLRGENNPIELSHTLRAVGRAALVLGALAALVLAVLHRPLARALLDDPTLGWMLAIVGLGVAAQVLYSVYDAFLRGFRRVGPLTKAAMLANVLATAVGSMFVLWLHTDGIVFALVSQPLFVLGVVAVVGRDFSKHLVPVDRGRVDAAVGRVLRMGVVLTITGFITTGVQLAARVLVERSASLDDAGYFQAAWAVSVLYLGFVLGALGLDYYPRLAALGGNRVELGRMVNEQAKMSLLLAGPAILGMLALSGPIIAILYTSKFHATVTLLRWQLIGDVLKVGCWTLSYLVLAQGSPRAYFFTELSANVAYLGVLAALLPALGLGATAAAYVASSAGYFITLCVVARRLAGFSWSRANGTLMIMTAVLAAVELVAFLLVGGWRATAIGCVITAVYATYCLRRLFHETGFIKLLRRGKSSVAS